MTLDFEADDGVTIQINFIDTPGTWTSATRSAFASLAPAMVRSWSSMPDRVWRSADGGELSHTRRRQHLEIIPVINNIDLPAADPARVAREIEDIIGIDAENAALVSAKTVQGVRELLCEIVRRVPPPTGDPGSLKRSSSIRGS